MNHSLSKVNVGGWWWYEMITETVDLVNYDQYDTVFEVLLLSRHYAIALQVKTLLWMVTSIQHSPDRT